MGDEIGRLGAARRECHLVTVMAMTEAEQLAMRRRINREIDEETARRMERAGYTRRPMGQEDEYVRSPDPAPVAAPAPRPQEAATMSPEASDAWNSWVRAAIDRRFEDIYLPGIAKALGMKGNELRDEFEPAIAAVKAEVAEQLQEQVAIAVRDFTTGALAPLRAELEDFKARLAASEAKLAAATGERSMAPLALPGRWMGHA